MMKNNIKILLPGGAGLVGQNLVARLKVKGYTNIVIFDKHRANLAILKRVQPDVTVVSADMTEPSEMVASFPKRGCGDVAAS